MVRADNDRGLRTTDCRHAAQERRPGEDRGGSGECAKDRRDHIDDAAVKHPNPRKHRSIRRLRWSPDREGVAWTLVLAIIAVTIFAAVVVYYPFLPQRNANAGFGPDWD